MVTCSFCSCGAPCDIHTKGYRVEVEPTTPADRAAHHGPRVTIWYRAMMPPKPHLRLHVGLYGWWVIGPKGCSWNFPKAHQAIRDYTVCVGL